MYQPLSCFSKQWIFHRNDPKVEPEDLNNIHLLSEQRAGHIWRDYISDEQIHPDHFTDNDWPNKQDVKTASSKVQWEKVWEGSQACLPDEILDHFSGFGDDTTVYFCVHNELIFELTWGVFKRSWKAFLFLDNGPILVGKKKKQAAQFYSNGWMNLLQRLS